MILKCRSCQGENIGNIMSFGFTPLANAYLTSEQRYETEERYPLDLVFCKDCALVQIVETVNPKHLFRNYFYTSSVSETVLENAKTIALQMIHLKNLGKESTVVEIGSNDGYLLKNYAEQDIPSIGVDPAKNLTPISKGLIPERICEFFGRETALKMQKRGIRADVIHANNVLAHVADLHGVVEGIYHLLKPDGVAVVETHYVKDMMEGCEFDCVYHEHLCYYSGMSLKNLFELHGMKLVGIERIPIHGGSLRAMFQSADGPCSLRLKNEDTVTWFLNQESHLAHYSYYEKLAERAQKLKNELKDLLWKLKIDRKKIAMYGAPAKSATFMHFMGIGRNLIDYVVDNTPLKQGHYTPGTHLEIVAPNSKPVPDVYLLASWNFMDEILAKEQDFLKAGGKFIVPIPELRIIDGTH